MSIKVKIVVLWICILERKTLLQNKYKLDYYGTLFYVNVNARLEYFRIFVEFKTQYVFQYIRLSLFYIIPKMHTDKTF